MSKRKGTKGQTTFSKKKYIYKTKDLVPLKTALNDKQNGTYLENLALNVGIRALTHISRSNLF